MHQCRGYVPLRCKVFARLNNCANGDEADVSFVQTQKTQSLYYRVRLTSEVRKGNNDNKTDEINRKRWMKDRQR